MIIRNTKCDFAQRTEGELVIITELEKQDISTPSSLKSYIQKCLDDDKAEDIITIDLPPESALADYMLIASGTSSKHVLSTAQKIKDRLNILGLKNIRIEGTETADWIIVDTGDVILHLFRPEVRDFYNIEKMWAPPEALENA